MNSCVSISYIQVQKVVLYDSNHRCSKYSWQDSETRGDEYINGDNDGIIFTVKDGVITLS